MEANWQLPQEAILIAANTAGDIDLLGLVLMRIRSKFFALRKSLLNCAKLGLNIGYPPERWQRLRDSLLDAAARTASTLRVVQEVILVSMMLLQ